MNQIINQIIELLHKLKEKSAVKELHLESGEVNISAIVNTESKRITLKSRPGQTILDFDNRKAETIRHLANCFMQAYEVCEGKLAKTKKAK